MRKRTKQNAEKEEDEEECGRGRSRMRRRKKRKKKNAEEEEEEKLRNRWMSVQQENKELIWWQFLSHLPYKGTDVYIIPSFHWLFAESTDAHSNKDIHICEHDNSPLDFCPNVTIISASFKIDDTSNYFCGTWNDVPINCSKDVTSQVARECTGQSRCIFGKLTDTFGDPCAEKLQSQFRYRYSCLGNVISLSSVIYFPKSNKISTLSNRTTYILYYSIFKISFLKYLKKNRFVRMSE